MYSIQCDGPADLSWVLVKTDLHVLIHIMHTKPYQLCVIIMSMLQMKKKRKRKSYIMQRNNITCQKMIIICRYSDSRAHSLNYRATAPFKFLDNLQQDVYINRGQARYLFLYSYFLPIISLLILILTKLGGTNTLQFF